MFAILFSWVIISFILFSFGDILLTVYNKICKQEESYNFIDKLLLGLCFIIIPLSVWSLWLPSNQYFLYICFGASVVYWSISHKEVCCLLSKAKEILKNLSYIQLSFFGILIVASLGIFIWEQFVYDSLMYHHQNIRWNEEYPVVPGLGNLDDKFGFNSNYFLVSAIFTFRFLFGEAIYTLQSLIITIIGCWIVYELFKSKYEVKRIIILLSYILLYWVSIYFLGNTSTDILPNFIVFYTIARLVLYPKLLKTNILLGIILPVFLLTCKLSFFPFCIISLYLLYHIIREKKYKTVVFACTVCLFIMLPWLTRNVIVSGYLIYPLYQIDLFSFDWKIPQEVAMKQKDYIFDIGYYFFRTAIKYPQMSMRDPFFVNILTDVIYILSFVSFIIISYKIVRKRKETDLYITILYAIFLLSILIWAIGGPDVRFISGVLCSIIFTGGIMLLRSEKYLIKTGKIFVTFFLLSLLLWSSYNFYYMPKDSFSKLFCQVAYKPYSIQNQNIAKGIVLDKQFKPYYFNNGILIWVHSDLSYDKFPSTIHSHYAKFSPIECLEGRGNTLQDGFRTKKKCN